MMLRQRGRAVRIAAGVAVAAMVVGGGVAAYADKANAPDEYRTATVAYGDVEQTLGLSGTITPSGRSDLSFTVAGTVAKLKAKVGDKVTKGEVLARLDTTGLKAAVTKAEAEVAAAKAQLAKDEDAQTATVSSAATSAAASSSTSSTSSSTTKKSSSKSSATGTNKSEATSSTDAALAKALSQIADEQRSVEADQTAVDTAIKVAGSALDAETTACKVSAEAAASDASTTDEPSASASATTDSGTASAPPPTGPGSVACTNAITAVQGDQVSVSAKEKALDAALTTLGGTLASASKAAQGTASTTTSGSAKSTGSSGAKATTPAKTASTKAASAASTSSGTRSSGSTTVTAATLAKDQASIDSAKASLVSASQALSGAVITAPAAGTVAQVSVSAGGSATAGSSAIVLIAPGTTTIEFSATSTQVAELTVGQKTEVSPAGSTTTYAGRVTRVGQVPSTDTSGSSTYPVTVTLDQRDLDLLTGATASVDVVLGSATHVLTVPTSAVSDGSVQVYDGDTVSRMRVTTSLVGQARTVVTSGLKAGQQVVLADVSTALPTTSSTTTNTRGGSFGGGSFGGGAPGGGFGQG